MYFLHAMYASYGDEKPTGTPTKNKDLRTSYMEKMERRVELTQRRNLKSCVFGLGG